MSTILKLKKLTKSFGGLNVINDVTASFLENKITSLIGPNGAGKTTLFHTITGSIPLDGGRIFLGNKEITGMKSHNIAQEGIGRLFQDVRVFRKLSVENNILSAIHGKDDENLYKTFFGKKPAKEYLCRCEEMLEYVGLVDNIKKNADELSYGQQKLLAIGRLLAGNFKILLLDEPTAGISPSMINNILGLLEKIVNNSGKTIILIEHNMDVVREISDWVYFMDEGKIKYSGRPSDILGEKGVREIYLGFDNE